MHLNPRQMSPLTLLMLVTAVLSLVGCSAEFSSSRNRIGTVPSGSGDVEVKPPVAKENIPGADGDEVLPPEGNGLSLRGHVRFKKQQLLANDIASALDLPKDQLCQEFDRLSCLDEVHHLAVGGVDAYEKSIFNGIEESLTTTPIVIERTILSACSNRASRDVNDGEGIIFAGLAGSPDSTTLGAAVTTLYRRALQRNPTADETAALTGLYEKVKGASQNPGSDWAALSCYAVLTSLEFVFY